MSKQKQNLDRSRSELNFALEQSISTIVAMRPEEAKRLSRQSLYEVYFRVPDDAELTGDLEKYRGKNCTTFQLLHFLCAEYMLKGLNPPGVGYLTMITNRLLGKMPLPLTREEEHEPELSAADLNRLLEE